MSRRQRKVRAARKPARKPRQAPKPSGPVRRPKTASQAKKQADVLDPFIAVGASSLGLNVEKAWLPAVRSHLEVTLRHGALVAGFALPDETDPAPVFEA